MSFVEKYFFNAVYAHSCLFEYNVILHDCLWMNVFVNFIFLKNKLCLFQIGLVACDNRDVDQLCGTSVAVITIIRDQFPPYFVNLPYQTTITRNQAINSTVQLTSARDDDLVVGWLFCIFCMKLFFRPPN